MKKIRNKRSLGIGLVMLAVALVALGAFLFADRQLRFLVTAALAGAYGLICLHSAFTRKGVLEELAGQTDERDQYLLFRTAHTTLQIMNYLLGAGCFICLVLYGVVRLQAFLVAAVTLCLVTVVLFVVSLTVGSYYEKRL